MSELREKGSVRAEREVNPESRVYGVWYRDLLVMAGF